MPIKKEPSKLDFGFNHTLIYQKLIENKISIYKSLTIVIYILMTTSSPKIKIFGQENQKFFKFKEFSLYDERGKLLTECTGFSLLNKTDWNSRCQFHQCFMFAFFVQMSFGSFSLFTCKWKKLPKRLLYKKIARKMLMKLTTG